MKRAEVVIFTAIVATECANVGLNTLYKAAVTTGGMSQYVFMAYAYGTASVLLLPSPFITHRRGLLPPINASIGWKIVLLGIVGSASQLMGFKGILYSSPALASAFSNLLPAFTFILALLFRMEKVSVGSNVGRAKIIGTVVSVTGAFVVTLYSGPSVAFPSSPTPPPSYPHKSNWRVGGLYLFGEYFLMPFWYIIQAKIMTEYPSEMTVICFYSMIVSIVAAITGILFNPQWSVWRVTHAVALLSVLCSGLFGSLIGNTVHTWALRLKGPVYVAMFKPLSIVIAIVMGVIFLRDTLHFGSVLGAAIISSGFYTVMWGKAKEAEEGRIPPDSSPLSVRSPLLPR